MQKSLKELISNDYMDAMKNKDTLKKNLLGVIKSEIITTEKNNKTDNLSEQEIIKILNKIAKGIRENVSAGSAEAIIELNIIESYLPRQLSNDEILNIVENIIDNNTFSNVSDLGKVMTLFNSEYSGQADGKTVSNITRELLTNKTNITR
jgi:uncharacterized protein YqeY